MGTLELSLTCQIVSTKMIKLSLFGLATVNSSEDSGTGNAKLLVSKRIQNKYLVEGKDVVIHYGLYNVGDNAATDVVLSEVGFGPNDFDVAGGQTVVKIDRIPPKANNTHVLVVRPKKFGYFNFTSAEVKYKYNDLDEIKTGFSSDPGQGLIISLKDYERQFSAHMLDWIAFAVMTLPSIGIPFLLWHSSKSKYESMKVKE